MPPIDADAIASQLAALNRASFEDDKARSRILQEAQKLCQRLETPYETMARLTFEEPTLNTALRIADEMSLLSSLGPAGSPPKTIQELAQPTSADPELVKRVLRHIAAKGFLVELPGNAYQSTELSEVLALKGGMIGPREVANRYMPIFQKAPAHLKSIGYTCPRDASDTTFQYALGQKGQTFFDWLQDPEHKTYSDEFNRLMRFNAAHNPSWMSVRPVDDLVKDADPSAPVLVDVGGGIGTDCIEFRKRYPSAAGKVVLQDLASATAQAEKEGNLGDIEAQAYDFFNPQPVSSARIYYMGSVLHDWPDEDARKILRNQRSALKKGYSRLLLSEFVLAEVGCKPLLSAIDLCMMTELAALERSDRQWTDLLESEGFKVVKIHAIPSCTKSVIEAELA